MFTKTKFKSYLSVMLIVLLIALLAGCAAKKAFWWGDVKKGLILEYRMPQDQALKYQFTSNMIQDMDVAGQTIKNIIDLNLLFSTKSKGLEQSNHLLLVAIDSAKTDIESSQGNFSPDMSSVLGKSFHITLSPLGKELKITGADSIIYNSVQGEQNLAPNFQTIFPDLSGKPVKIGDTWTTNDTININQGQMEMRMTFVSVNTLQGLETVAGHECAKITAKTTGKLEGEGEQMGANLYFEGDIEGKDTWYFAYKKGIFVKSISDGVTKGNIAVTGPQKMTIPMTMETKFETKLVK